MSRTRRLAGDTLAGYLRLTLQSLVFFWLTPKMLNALGASNYGLWILVASGVGLLGLLEGGLGITTLRASARRDPAEITALGWAHLGLGLGCLGATAVLVQVWPVGSPALVWLLGARFVFLQIPMSYFRNLLSGTRIGLVSRIQAVSIVVYGVVAWLLLDRGAGLLTLAWWNLAHMLCEHLLYWALLGEERPSLRGLRPALLPGLVSFSACSFVGTIAAQILLRSDPLVLKLFLPLSSVAVYAVAMKVAENAHLLTKQLVNVLTPLAAELQSRGEEYRTRRLLLEGTRFALLPALLLSLAIVPRASVLMASWLGPEMAPAGPVLGVLMLAMTLAIPQMVASTVLAMGGREGFTAKAAGVSCLLNLALSLALTPFTGLVGPALGTLATTLIIDVGMVIPEALRHLQVSWREYLRRAILPALIPALGGLALSLALGGPESGRAPQLLHAAAWSLPGPALGLALFWCFCVTPHEKARLGLIRQPKGATL